MFTFTLTEEQKKICGEEVGDKFKTHFVKRRITSFLNGPNLIRDASKWTSPTVPSFMRYMVWQGTAG